MELKKMNDDIDYEIFNIEEKYDKLNSVKNNSIRLFLKNDGVRDEPFKLKVTNVNNNEFMHYEIDNEIPSLTYIIYKEDGMKNVFFEMSKDDVKFKRYSKDSRIVYYKSNKGNYIRYKKDRYMCVNVKSQRLINTPGLVILLKYDNENEDDIKKEDYNVSMSINITKSEDIINFDLFDDILYCDKDYKKLDSFLIKNVEENMKDALFIFSIKKNNPMIEIKDLIRDKNDKLFEDIKNFKAYDNRFIQRHHKKGYIDYLICDYIVDECDKHNKWDSDKYFEIATQDVSVFSIETIKHYVIKILEKMYVTIKECYSIENKIDFRDIFVVKYDTDKASFLSMHTDNDFLSFQILLNNDFEGGGTYFADGITMKPEKGDLIIHNGQQIHGALPITKGKRYLLVGFFNITEE